MPDHLHVFLGLKPSMAVSDIVREIKNNSSKFINEKHFYPWKFFWQEGYGVFSYSSSHVEKVFNYIKNQEIHHKKATFREEYLNFLKKYRIEYEDKYLFEWLD